MMKKFIYREERAFPNPEPRNLYHKEEKSFSSEQSEKTNLIFGNKRASFPRMNINP